LGGGQDSERQIRSTSRLGAKAAAGAKCAGTAAARKRTSAPTWRDSIMPPTSGRNDRAYPTDAERPADAGGAKVGRIIGRGECIGGGSSADDAEAGEEDRKRRQRRRVAGTRGVRDQKAQRGVEAQMNWDVDRFRRSAKAASCRRGLIYLTSPCSRASQLRLASHERPSNSPPR
jgi:hypothetical protein